MAEVAAVIAVEETGQLPLERGNCEMFSQKSLQ